MKRRCDMFSNKKGLSTVVTTLIIILLVLVAIGIVWVVIRGVIESGAGQIDVSSKCPMLDIRVTDVNTTSNQCNGLTCQIEIYRASGGDENKVFYTIAATNGTSTCMNTTTNDIQPLETRRETVTFKDGCTLGGINAKEVTVTPMLFDSSNQPKLCPNSNKYTI
jgi:hypothetical protein